MASTLIRALRTRPGLSFLVFWMLAVPTATSGQRGALTVSRGIDQLAGEAALIVHGRVTSARVEPHPQLRNLQTVLISMTVEGTWKGTASRSFQFRQYIWDPRDQIDSARYQKGQELLLFLGPVSEYGLCSPVGLEQGRFRIMRDRKGRAFAVNGRDNVGLFQSIDTRARAKGVTLSAQGAAFVRQAPHGLVALSDLEDIVRSFARAK